MELSVFTMVWDCLVHDELDELRRWVETLFAFDGRGAHDIERFKRIRRPSLAVRMSAVNVEFFARTRRYVDAYLAYRQLTGRPARELANCDCLVALPPPRSQGATVRELCRVAMRFDEITHRLYNEGRRLRQNGNCEGGIDLWPSHEAAAFYCCGGDRGFGAPFHGVQSSIRVVNGHPCLVAGQLGTWHDVAAHWTDEALDQSLDERRDYSTSHYFGDTRSRTSQRFEFKFRYGVSWPIVDALRAAIRQCDGTIVLDYLNEGRRRFAMPLRHVRERGYTLTKSVRSGSSLIELGLDRDEALVFSPAIRRAFEEAIAFETTHVIDNPHTDARTRARYASAIAAARAQLARYLEN